MCCDWIPEPDGPIMPGLKPVLRDVHRPWSVVRSVQVGDLTVAWEAKSDQRGPYRILTTIPDPYPGVSGARAFPMDRDLPGAPRFAGAWWTVESAGPLFYQDWKDIAALISDVMEVVGLANPGLDCWGVEDALIRAMDLTREGKRDCWTLLKAVQAGTYAEFWAPKEDRESKKRRRAKAA